MRGSRRRSQHYRSIWCIVATASSMSRIWAITLCCDLLFSYRLSSLLPLQSARPARNVESEDDAKYAPSCPRNTRRPATFGTLARAPIAPVCSTRHYLSPLNCGDFNRFIINLIRPIAVIPAVIPAVPHLGNPQRAQD